MAPPGRRRLGPSTTTMLLGLLLLFTGTASAVSAVLGVDIGTEYIKAAIVKPGIPLGIVLTKDSRRKEAAAVAFKPLKAGSEKDVYPERAYGADALAISARFPTDVYTNLKPLLGRPFTPDVVHEYTKRHPGIELVQSNDRPTISVKSHAFADNEDHIFSVEELLAMQLLNVRENAKATAGKGFDVTDVVFTIPSFFTADEKRALEAAANLAGLNVLGLVTDGLAVGLNYATSRTFPDVSAGAKPEHHLIFDMGAGSTTATILRFQSRAVKDVGRFNKTVQEVAVLGSGWDRTLGGDALNGVILDDMVDKFVESPAAKKLAIKPSDVHSHPRTIAKLWKDAEKVRQVLSANTATGSTFESLYEDTDFKYKLTRADFETMAADFAQRVDGPIIQALASSGLDWSDIDSIILHGGASRTPFVQKRLEGLVDDPAKVRSSVNADEAAVFGAAFKAATLSPSFRVKEIRDSDTIGYPVGVQYMWNLKDRLQNLFTPTSKAGVVKELPFKMMGEFEFTLYQTVPNNSEEPARAPIVHTKTGNMTRVVSQLIDENGCDRDLIDTKFSVRINPTDGIPEVVNGWVSCEVDETDKKDGVMDSVKGFFGFGDKKDGQEPLKEGEEAVSTETVELESSTTASASESTETAETKSKTDKTDKADKADGEKSKDTKPKKKTIKSAISYTATQQGYEKHPRKEWKRMQDRLTAFDASDKARRAREELHNSLEAFTYRARDLLEDAAFIESSSKEDRTKLEEILSATSDWLYEEGSSASAEVLEARLKALKDIVNPIQKRKEEARARPEKLKALKDAIEQTRSFYKVIEEQVEKSAAEASSSSAAAESSSSTTAEPASSSADPLADLEEEITSSSTEEAAKPSNLPEFQPYTKEDVEDIKKAVDAVEDWFTSKLAEQDKLQPYEDAVFTVSQLEAKAAELNQVTMTIFQKKMKPPKKQSKKPKSTKKPKKSKTTSQTATESSAAAEETPQVVVDELPIDNEEAPKIVEDVGEDAEKARKHDEL